MLMMFRSSPKPRRLEHLGELFLTRAGQSHVTNLWNMELHLVLQVNFPFKEDWYNLKQLSRS
jgi:hypothetical protein